MKKGAIYARVSTDRQEYDRQIQELKDYAYRNDIDIKYVFEEKMSGLNSERPEYNKLMQLTKDDIDIVLIWELSRLSRKSIEIQSDVEKLTEKGINLYIKNNNISTLDEFGRETTLSRIVITMIATFAEEEIKTSKQRSKSAKQHYVLKEGRSYTYQAPFGYYLENKHLHINKEEAATVKLIFDMSINGYSSYAIALYLNTHNIKPRKRDRWIVSSIIALLNNPIYYGKPKYCIERSKNKDKKEDKYVELDKPELAIISEQDFLKCAEARDKRKHKSNASNGNIYLLKNLIKCPDCGYYLSYDRNSKRQKYKCSVKYNKTYNMFCENSPTLEADKLERAVWDCIKYYCFDELAKDKLVKDKQPILDEITDYNNTIEKINENIKHLNDDIELIISVATDLKKKFPDRLNLYNNKMNEIIPLDAEITKLNNEINRYKQLILKCEGKLKAIDSIKELPSYLDGITYETKYELFHKLIDYIVPYKIITGTTIIKVYLKSGFTFLIGYYSHKDFCIQFEETSDIVFDTNNLMMKVRSNKPATISKDGKIDLNFAFKEELISPVEFLSRIKSPENTIVNERTYKKSSVD